LHQIKTETIDIPNRVITSPDDLSVVETREIFRILDAGLRAGFGVPVYTADVMGAFLRAVFDSGYWSPGDSGNRREIPDIWLPFAAVTFSPAVACTGRLVPDQDPCQLLPFHFFAGLLLTRGSWSTTRLHYPATDYH
jgi:hypothetical protein